jgi:hypothetical protein
MVKCDKKVPVSSVRSRSIAGFLCPVILFGTLFTWFTLLAGPSSDIAKYTLEREKNPEFVSSILQSGKRPEIEINEHGGAYQIKVVALIAAPASYVRDVLTDYRLIYRLNPSIIESDVLKEDDDGAINVKTKVVGCAAYFCEELDRVEKVRLLPSGDIQAEIIPELSQFKSGKTLWQIKSVGNYCEVTYLSDMEPDIYIPPVVGKFLIKKSIREEMQISFTNLEKISSVLAVRARLENYQPANDQTVTKDVSRDNCIACADIEQGRGE